MAYKRAIIRYIKSYAVRIALIGGFLISVLNSSTSQDSQDIWESDTKQIGRNTYECRISFEGRDPVSRETRLDLMPEHLFTYTEDQLRSFLPERDFLVCTGSLTSISGGFRSLVLHLKLASANAKKTYGGLLRGSPLTITLLDGKEITLINQRSDPGVLDPDTGETTYTGIFRIDVTAEKMLTKSEVDQMRIVWTTGFEIYEMHNVDFFINQFNCLNSNR